MTDQIDDIGYLLKKYKDCGSFKDLNRLKHLVDSLLIMEVNQGLTSIGQETVPVKSVSLPKKDFIYNVSSIERVIDGDSIDAVLDLGFHISHKVSIRVNGIDTPEKNTLEGKLVKAYVEEWFKTGAFTVISKELDKYGRVLGTITKITSDLTVDLRTLLVSHGYARVYNGDRKTEWTVEQLAVIRESLGKK